MRTRKSKRPISARQLAANRANAQKSTGPRTPAGREAVSLNALKHGLTGSFRLLPGEDPATHAAFCRELIEEFAPANALEFNLAQTITNDLWRLSRASAIETNMFAVGVVEDNPDPTHSSDMQLALAGARTFLNHVGKFGVLSLYEQRLNRAIRNNHVELREIQSERRKAISPNVIPISDMQPRIAPNGFVRANNVSAPGQAA